MPTCCLYHRQPVPLPILGHHRGVAFGSGANSRALSKAWGPLRVGGPWATAHLTHPGSQSCLCDPPPKKGRVPTLRWQGNLFSDWQHGSYFRYTAVSFGNSSNDAPNPSLPQEVIQNTSRMLFLPQQLGGSGGFWAGFPRGRSHLKRVSWSII